MDVKCFSVSDTMHLDIAVIKIKLQVGGCSYSSRETFKHRHSFWELNFLWRPLKLYSACTLLVARWRTLY